MRTSWWTVAALLVVLTTIAASRSDGCERDGVWPATPLGHVASRPCPGGQGNHMVRTCSRDGRGWQGVDMSQCVQDTLKRLLRLGAFSRKAAPQRSNAPVHEASPITSNGIDSDVELFAADGDSDGEFDFSNAVLMKMYLEVEVVEQFDLRKCPPFGASTGCRYSLPGTTTTATINWHDRTSSSDNRANIVISFADPVKGVDQFSYRSWEVIYDVDSFRFGSRSLPEMLRPLLVGGMVGDEITAALGMPRVNAVLYAARYVSGAEAPVLATSHASSATPQQLEGSGPRTQAVPNRVAEIALILVPSGDFSVQSLKDALSGQWADPASALRGRALASSSAEVFGLSVDGIEVAECTQRFLHTRFLPPSECVPYNGAVTDARITGSSTVWYKKVAWYYWLLIAIVIVAACGVCQYYALRRGDEALVMAEAGPPKEDVLIHRDATYDVFKTPAGEVVIRRKDGTAMFQGRHGTELSWDTLSAADTASRQFYRIGETSSAESLENLIHLQQVEYEMGVRETDDKVGTTGSTDYDSKSDYEEEDRDDLHDRRSIATTQASYAVSIVCGLPPRATDTSMSARSGASVDSPHSTADSPESLHGHGEVVRTAKPLERATAHETGEDTAQPGGVIAMAPIHNNDFVELPPEQEALVRAADAKAAARDDEKHAEPSPHPTFGPVPPVPMEEDVKQTAQPESVHRQPKTDIVAAASQPKPEIDAEPVLVPVPVPEPASQEPVSDPSEATPAVAAAVGEEDAPPGSQRVQKQAEVAALAPAAAAVVTAANVSRDAPVDEQKTVKSPPQSATSAKVSLAWAKPSPAASATSSKKGVSGPVKASPPTSGGAKQDASMAATKKAAVPVSSAKKVSPAPSSGKNTPSISSASSKKSNSYAASAAARQPVIGTSNGKLPSAPSSNTKKMVPPAPKSAPPAPPVVPVASAGSRGRLPEPVAPHEPVSVSYNEEDGDLVEVQEVPYRKPPTFIPSLNFGGPDDAGPRDPAADPTVEHEIQNHSSRGALSGRNK